MIKVLICGINGKMGNILYDLIAKDSEIETICGVDIQNNKNYKIPIYNNFKNIKEKIDIIIDFSSPTVLKEELEFAIKNKTPVVIATTGLSENENNFIKRCSNQIPIFYSANFSLGIFIINKLIKQAKEFLGQEFDVEIIEKHHKLKKDKPSGTALMLAKSVSLKNDYPVIHSVRAGNIVGEHEIIFAGTDEIISFKHTALSKQVFALGAIKACKFILSKTSGLYSMEDL